MNERIPGLEALFMLLHSAGMAVSVDDVGRLATIFSLAPELDENALRQVIETSLVHAPEQRTVFDRVYRRWFDAMDRDIVAREVSAEQRARRRAKASSTEASRAASAPAPATKVREQALHLSLDDIASLADEKPAHANERAHKPGASPAESQGLLDIRQMAALHTQDSTASGSEPHGAALASGASGAAFHAQHHVLSAAQAESAPTKRSRTGLALLVALTLVVCGLGIWRLWPADKHQGKPVQTLQDAGAGPEHANPPMLAADEFRAHEPRLETRPQEPPPRNYAAYVLMLLSLVLGVGLWMERGRGRRVPVPRTRRRRAPRVPEAPRTRRRDVASLILDERDEEDLVWGVSRFVSDEQGRDLDVKRTVDDTASAFGRPVLRYQAARYQREAWLWIDESLDTPVARHLASDLVTMLERSGLPVTTARFWGICDTLHVEGEEDMSVDAFDSRRDSAAIAILTDGRLMSAAHRARNRRGDLHRLLRNLSFWPRVTFIDFGRGDLRAIAEPHGLRVIQPHDAPAAISDLAESIPRREPGLLMGDARVWAAACALTPFPVSDRTAFSLRRLLGLNASPWTIEYMRRTAMRQAGGLTWSLAHRSDLLSWLVDAQAIHNIGDIKKLPRTTLLVRVVDGWNKLLDERERTQRTIFEQRGETWEGSDEAKELRLERAMITLWTRPDEAVAWLYELFCNGYGERICNYMQQLIPHECEDECEDHEEGVLTLPWRLRALRRDTQVWLQEMGFASRGKTWPGHRSMPRPARLWLAMGLCAGMALGAAAAVVKEIRTASHRRPVVEGEAPDKSYVRMEPVGDQPGQWTVTAGTMWNHHETRSIRVGENEKVAIAWDATIVPCTERRGDVEILRCNSESKLPETSPERRSIAIVARQDDTLARKVAYQLLDSGTVDEAFLVTAPIDYKALDLEAMMRPGPLGKNDQILLVAPEPWPDAAAFPGPVALVSIDDLGRLRTLFDFARGAEKSLGELAGVRAGQSIKKVENAMPEMRIAGTYKNFMVRGMGECGDKGQRCCGEGVDATCDGDLVCRDSTCVEAEIDCEPGAKECRGNTLVTCLASGTKEASEDCGDDRVCEDGQCVIRTCEPGAVECSNDGRYRRVCNARGTGYDDTWCKGASLCVNRSCTPIRDAYIHFAKPQIKVDTQLRANRLPVYIKCNTVGDNVILDIDSFGLNSKPSLHIRPRRKSREFSFTCKLIHKIGNSAQEVATVRKEHQWDLRLQRGKHRLTLLVDQPAKLRGTIRIDLPYTIWLGLPGRDTSSEQYLIDD